MRRAVAGAGFAGIGRFLATNLRGGAVGLALHALVFAALVIIRGESGRSFSNMGHVLRDKILGAKVVDLAAELMAASDLQSRPMLMQKLGREGPGGPAHREAVDFYNWRFRHNQIMQRGLNAIMLDPMLQTNSIDDVIALKIFEFIAPAWNALKRASKSVFG
jgi:hypothetical protein